MPAPALQPLKSTVLAWDSPAALRLPIRAERRRAPLKYTGPWVDTDTVALSAVQELPSQYFAYTIVKEEKGGLEKSAAPS